MRLNHIRLFYKFNFWFGIIITVLPIILYLLVFQGKYDREINEIKQIHPVIFEFGGFAAYYASGTVVNRFLLFTFYLLLIHLKNFTLIMLI